MSTPEHARARRHLSRRDATLRPLVRAVGPCTLTPNPHGFASLAQAIISQQISTIAARAIRDRLRQAVAEDSGSDALTAEAVLALSPERLRAAGLSAAKARSLHDLADRVTGGQLPLDRLPALPDDEVIDLLLPVRGIGRWTAQMYLIFSLGRPDVLPVDDYGLRAAVRDIYALADLPSRADLEQLAHPWRPYRSIATWYLWRSRDLPPATARPGRSR